MPLEKKRERQLAVLLHADVVGSTKLVQRNEVTAHGRITDAFSRFSTTIKTYGGVVHEVRGDALVAEFPRASDAVTAAIAFQLMNAQSNEQHGDGIVPEVRVGISLGEVVIADDTVTGPGIVLAQRVEQLAAPGGVCVTAAVHEAIPGRIPFDYRDLEEQSAKGFDDPIHVYAVTLRRGVNVPDPDTLKAGERKPTWQLMLSTAIVLVIAVFGALAWLQPWQPEFEPARPDEMAFALPHKPSIAVLPFDNLTGDDSQDYISDGLSENIIAVLATSPELLVIARNSTFAYKGKPVDVREVAERLGVRYILEGSVQRSGETMRVTAQLIDAINGQHVWAKRYDNTAQALTNLLQLQDEIASQILVELDVTLTTGAHVRGVWAELKDLDSYRNFIRQRDEFSKWTPDGNREFERLAGELIAERPEVATPYRMMGWVHYQKVALGMTNDKQGSKDLASSFANKALALNEKDYLSIQLLAYLAMEKKDCADAIDKTEQVLALAPPNSISIGIAGDLFVICGLAERGVALLQEAIRIQPNSDGLLAALTPGLRMLGRLKESHSVAQAVVAAPVTSKKFFGFALRELAILAVEAGDEPTAKKYIDRWVKLDPGGANVAEAERTWAQLKNREFVVRSVAALRQAGLPEKAP